MPRIAIYPQLALLNHVVYTDDKTGMILDEVNKSENNGERERVFNVALFHPFSPRCVVVELKNEIHL